MATESTRFEKQAEGRYSVHYKGLKCGEVFGSGRRWTMQDLQGVRHSGTVSKSRRDAVQAMRRRHPELFAQVP